MRAVFGTAPSSDKERGEDAFEWFKRKCDELSPDEFHNVHNPVVPQLAVAAIFRALYPNSGEAFVYEYVIRDVMALREQRDALRTLRKHDGEDMLVFARQLTDMASKCGVHDSE